MNKPILCLDFDGVIHSYASGWVQADFIPDPPVPGAFQFLLEALDSFKVVIFSSRSHQEGGVRAMQLWLEYWARRELPNDKASGYAANRIINMIAWNKDAWPTAKPAAFLSIDDRALTFDGTWPKADELLAFKPWNNAPKAPPSAIIKLTPAEVQSAYSRQRYAEGLIEQLPAEHDGRNTWLLNYGIGDEARRLRERKGLSFDDSYQAVVSAR